MPDVKCQLEEFFCAVPFFINLMDDLGEIGTACFKFKMKPLRDSMILCKTVSCLNVYLPCCSDTLQLPKMCAVTT